MFVTQQSSKVEEIMKHAVYIHESFMIIQSIHIEKSGACGGVVVKALRY
jgi:hypothetical protein